MHRLFAVRQSPPALIANFEPVSRMEGGSDLSAPKRVVGLSDDDIRLPVVLPLAVVLGGKPRTRALPLEQNPAPHAWIGMCEHRSK